MMNRVLPISIALVACTSLPPEEPPIDPVMTVSIEELDLGAITCGTHARSSFRISNPSGGRLELALLSTLPGVVVTPAELAIEPFQSATIEVTAGVPRVATPGFLSRGDLVIGGNAGSVRIPISYAAAGAIVRVDQATVDFGELVTRSSVRRDLAVSVTGTAGATVTLSPPSSASFRIVGSPTATIAADDAHVFGLVLDAGATETAHAATLPLAVTGDLCTPPPTEVALTGRATDDLLAISTTAIDFGSPPCAVFSTREIEMTNHGPTDVQFRLTRTDPAGFISGEFSSIFLQGSLAAGETDGATVVHARVPFELDLPIGSYAAQLEVTLNQTITRTIPVFTSIDRPVLALGTRDIDAGTAAIGTFEHTFVITNDGNQPDDIQIDAIIDAAGATVELSPTAFQLAPQHSQTVTVRTTTASAAPVLTNVFVLGRCEADTVLIRSR